MSATNNEKQEALRLKSTIEWYKANEIRWKPQKAKTEAIYKQMGESQE